MTYDSTQRIFIRHSTKELPMNDAAMPEVINIALLKLEKDRETLMKLVDVARDVERIVADLAEDGIAVTYHEDTHNMGIWISGSLSDMKTVAVIRRSISDMGYRMKGEISDYPEEGRFVITHKKDDKCIILNIRLPVGDGNGATCRYVKVGEKTVPIYERKCEPAGVAS